VKVIRKASRGKISLPLNQKKVAPEDNESLSSSTLLY